ncbi:MAG: RNA polymerase sigma factor [Oscillospiraceae bacterium]|nr:RNA polymerase sigma factor [Oscillospiraceae bacterium]
MSDALQRGERTVTDVYDEHARMLYRIAFTYMKNRHDSEDALQECFLRYIRGKVVFADPQHEKGWLIVTLTNICRDMLKSKYRQHENLDNHTDLAVPPPETSALMEAILKLPDRYKAAIYLYYYEGYSVKEIASMLRQPSNTVKTRLSRARKLLKNELGGDLDV